MRVSINWLREYIDLSLSPEELADLLTMAGFEVGGILKMGNEVENVVVGEIESIYPHPNADRLKLCKIKTGDRSFEVVCGASNIHVGDRVPLALDGARLVDGVKIKRSKIRGVVSEGMLCSEKELGLSQDAEGIMILSKEAELGRDIKEVVEIEDVVLDISIPPNRPDCMSLIGIAREIGVLTGRKVKIPRIEIRENERDVKDYIEVSILDKDLCPRYSAKIITGIKVEDSPLWLKRRLMVSGIRPICNVVDITNYVLLEWGHPLHAFDYKLLEGGKIFIRRAKKGEKIVTLDNTERELSEETLIISDANRPVALAGIMGGRDSAITQDTDTVLLESAYFNPTNIRRTSKRFNLRTESSVRFERGANPEGVIWALIRASQLISDICGGEVIKGVIDKYPNPVRLPEIKLRVKRVNSVLGTDFKEEDILRCLKNSEMKIKVIENGVINIIPPAFRIDIKEEVDLIEEIARLMGYDMIPSTTPVIKVKEGERSKIRRLERRVKESLVAAGLYEVINYSFISPSSFDKLSLNPDHPYRKALKILNPLREEESIMRTTLIPGLLETLRHNLHRKNMNVRLFEIGKVFIPKGMNELPLERSRVTGILSGLRYEESWSYRREEIDFYDVKGLMENLFNNLRIYDKISFYHTENIEYLHPGKSATILIDGTSLGYLGELHPKVLDNYEIPKKVFIFDLDLDTIFEFWDEEREYKPISRFPWVNRDVALVVDKGLSVAEINKVIEDVKPEYLRKFKIFDVYEGDPVPPDKKSIAYRFRYQAFDRTLTDEEVNSMHERFISKVLNIIKGEIRK